MSDLPLCYAAAPYSDPSATIRRWHVARAVLLARLAMACGYAPFESHTSILAGVYGDDSDPEQRKRGMEASAAICRGVLSTPGAEKRLTARDRVIERLVAEFFADLNHTGNLVRLAFADVRRDGRVADEDLQCRRAAGRDLLAQSLRDDALERARQHGADRIEACGSQNEGTEIVIVTVSVSPLRTSRAVPKLATL